MFRSRSSFAAQLARRHRQHRASIHCAATCSSSHQCARTRTVKAVNDYRDYRSGQARARSQLGDGSHHALPARHGFLQTSHAPVHLEAFPRTRATFTLINRTASVRLGEMVGMRAVPRATRSHAQAALPQVGAGLARGQQLLRPPRHLRARLPRLAGARFPPLRLRTFRAATGNCISASMGCGREHRCGRFTHSPRSAN